MTVLYIIGFLAVVLLLLFIVANINEYSMKHYSYEFFSFGNLAVVAVAYLMLFYGDKWYLEELAKAGDILNGQILMGIGVLIICALIYIHIKSTSIIFATVVTSLANSEKKPIRFYINLGILEESYKSSINRFVSILEKKNYDYIFEYFPGSHEYINWAEYFGVGMKNLIGPSPSSKIDKKN